MHVTVDDVRLFFDVEGAKLVPDGPAMREKPTLLLLHGGPGHDHAAFKPFYSRFADICQVVYLDQRGHGRSDAGDPATWTLAQWADDVRAFCDALGIERPIVLGASFGGFVAQAYAARHPEHAVALILLSTRCRFVLDRQLAAFERRGGPGAREAARRFFGEVTPDVLADFQRVCLPLYTVTPRDPFVARRMIHTPDVLRLFAAREGRHFDFRADLARVRCPVLVLVGEEDPMTPPADAEELVAALSNARARLERIADAGHAITPDAPDAVERAIRHFILAQQAGAT